MNKSERYFIELISSHLNNSPPPVCTDADLNELYRLANINNVLAIVACQLLKLPKNTFNNPEILSHFKQQLGYTIMDYDEKVRIQEQIMSLFEKNDMDYMLVKGAVLREYYPAKEYRTSGDIDFIIRHEDLDKCVKLFKEKNLALHHLCDYGFETAFNTQNIEIHTNENFDNPYFRNIFDYAKKDGRRYILGDNEHLLYVLCHIIKHFNYCGAGIRMFMDIDVLIRHMENFDFDAFIAKCATLGIDTFAKASFSLCSYWFKTPVKAEIDFEQQSEFRELFEKEIIGGGSFGYSKRSLSDFYLNKGLKNTNRVSAVSKIKAIFAMFFPPASYLTESKNPFVILLAWFKRLYGGVFKRGAKSTKTISTILSADETSNEYKKLLNELNI